MGKNNGIFQKKSTNNSCNNSNNIYSLDSWLNAASGINKIIRFNEYN